MKQFEYKGYMIMVSMHPQNPQPFYAETNGEGHWSSTEEGAVNLVKSYIDALPTLREISFPKMKEYEIEAVKKMLKKENGTIFIKRQLMTKHYITANGKIYIEPKFLYHHSDELQRLLLEEEGYTINLKGDEFCVGMRTYFFAYDADFFKTEREVFELKRELYRKQIKEEE